jgi:hypothetical protein
VFVGSGVPVGLGKRVGDAVNVGCNVSDGGSVFSIIAVVAGEGLVTSVSGVLVLVEKGGKDAAGTMKSKIAAMPAITVRMAANAFRVSFPIL